MPVPSPRSKLLPARGNAADLQANVTALVDGEICYAVDENAYYQKVGTSLVKVESSGGGGSYDDTALAARVTTAEGEIDTLQTTVSGLSNYDDTALAGRVTTAEGEIDTLQTTVSGLSNYDDTALAGRVTTNEGDITTLQTTVSGLSNYDDTAIEGRVTANEGNITTLQSDVSSKLGDAPSDGSQYARKDGAWEVVEAGSSDIVATVDELDGYRWMTKVDASGLDLAAGTDLQPGEWTFTHDGNQGQFYANPVDSTGVDRGTEITTDFNATGTIYVSVDSQYGPFVAMAQDSGAFIQGSNGYVTFLFTTFSEFEAIDLATNSVAFATVQEPAAVNSTAAADGTHLVAVNGTFRPTADTLAGKSDVSITDIQTGEALVWNGTEFENSNVSASSSIATADDFANTVEPAVEKPFEITYETQIQEWRFLSYGFNLDQVVAGQFSTNWDYYSAGDAAFFFANDDGKGNLLMTLLDALKADQGNPANNAIDIQIEIGMDQYDGDVTTHTLDVSPGYELVDGVVRLYSTTLAALVTDQLGSDYSNEPSDHAKFIRFVGLPEAGGTRALTAGDVVRYDGTNFVNAEKRAPDFFDETWALEELLNRLPYIEFTNLTANGFQNDGTFTANLDMSAAANGSYSLEGYTPTAGGTSSFVALSAKDVNGTDTFGFLRHWALDYRGNFNGDYRDSEVVVQIDMPGATVTRKMRLYDTIDNGTYPGFQFVDSYGDAESYGAPHTFALRDGVAIASVPFKTLIEDAIIGPIMVSNDAADVGTINSIKIYVLPMTRTNLDAGAVLAWDPALKGYVPRRGVQVTRVGSPLTDAEHGNKLFAPPNQDQVGFIGEMRMDPFNNKIYIFSGVYDSYNGKGGWLEIATTSIISGNDTGGGAPA